MARPFVFDAAWDFEVPADQLWDAICRTDRYTDWWPWLIRFDADGIHTGEVADCVVRAPLPYRLRFRVEILDVVDGRRIDGLVSGDISGPATLELTSDHSGSRARLAWSLEVHGRLLSALSAVARPILVRGHDHIVGEGLHEFVTRALQEAAEPVTPRD